MKHYSISELMNFCIRNDPFLKTFFLHIQLFLMFGSPPIKENAILNLQARIDCKCWHYKQL